MDSSNAENPHQFEALQIQPSRLTNSGEPKIPRPDGGKDAWLFLCGGFSVEALVWGRYWILDTQALL